MSAIRSAGRHIRTAAARLRGEAGVAVPMALLCLVLLSTLVIGFSVLSALEPTIAGNQLAAAQARALAEAGVERALWALSNPTLPDGIPATFTTAPPPYDGVRLVPVSAGATSIGELRVTVTNGAAPYERRITAVGIVPGAQAPGRRAVQTIDVTAINPQLIAKDPPGAVSVRGSLRAGDNVQVDARSDASCGAKVGTITHGETSLAGATLDVRGAGGDATARNRVIDAAGGAVAAGGDIVKNTASAVFDAIALTDADLDALRALAKARGTYARGAVRFGADNRLPNGLVFVDAPSGGADLAAVTVDAGAPAEPDGVWSGWLIVNGAVQIGGDARLRGLVYAQGTIAARAAGQITLSGALVSRNVRDLPDSALDAEPGGQLRVAYDCADARTGGGTIPGRWSVKGGGYREVSGS